MPAKMSKKPVEKKPILYAGGEPSEKPLLYANNVEVSISSFDFQIRLNWIMDTDASGRPLAVNQGTVAMSPEHAKSLAALLVDSLHSYQQQHGTIPGRPPIGLVDPTDSE